MSKTPTSALHLQMGQEVLYLLLVTSLICNLLLVGLVMRAHAREPSAREPSPDEMAATITRLEGEKAGLLLQVRQLNDTLEDAKRERANLDASVEQAQSARVQLEGWVKELEGKLKIQKTPLEDQPPIIMLRDTEGYSFDPGSADIKPEFLSRLANEIVPKLIALGEKYSAQIVEVIGHTDGTAITDRLRVKANIDEFLGQALDNSSTIQVVPYDNAGLELCEL